jgi:hypothetical protein
LQVITMHDPTPTRDDTRSQDERNVSDGIQRVVIRIACGAFAIIAGTFAVIASALATKDQVVFLAVGLVVIGAGLVVIRVELRRRSQIEQQR